MWVGVREEEGHNVSVSEMKGRRKRLQVRRRQRKGERKRDITCIFSNDGGRAWRERNTQFV